MSHDLAGLTERIRAYARNLGFALCGFTSAEPASTIDQYRKWLANDHHGHMAYLARPDAVAKRADMACILPEVRTVLTVAANYHTASLPLEVVRDPARGIIASYAWGDDYHDVLTLRLHQLAAYVEEQTGQPAAYRAYVDTGPVLERDLAARAGLGFVGKNTNLIHSNLGSWLFLGELLLTIELPWKATKPAGGTCGRCTRCLDACPTNAFVAPYVLDARRCISYLTIELRDPIPRDLRPLMGNHIFGCDICQEVCPWNRRFAHSTSEPAFQPRPGIQAPALLDLMALDDEGFRARFQGSPIKRVRRRGLLHNVAVALGNWGNPAAVPALVRALQDTEPLIRGHAAWALGRISAKEDRRALEQALLTEIDAWVQEELELALADQSKASPT